MNKLKVGTRIAVHGFVMLKGLDNGCLYEAVKMDSYSTTFKRILKNGKLSKKSVRHYTNSVSISNSDCEYINYIEIV